MELLESKRSAISYPQLSLTALLEHVVLECDRAALEEFHENRRPFGLGRGKALRLFEFVDRLGDLTRRRPAAHLADETIEGAISLTIDKFSRLPSDHSNGNGKHAGRPETDCRNYIRPYLEIVARLRPVDSTAIQEEMLTAQFLETHVTRHFRYSLKECQRSSNPAVSRYTWHVNGGRIDVWFPRTLSGTERRIWLETHVENPAPTRTDEKRRIQHAVDQEFSSAGMVSLESPAASGLAASVTCEQASWAIMEGISREGLAEVVANEKASTSGIERQRPAIRQLGPESLASLIREIFDQLDAEDYRAGAIAERFGVSPAAFSRFAGSHWDHDTPERIPDLWLNTARVLSLDQRFKEVAQAAGVWKRVEQVLDARGEGSGRNESHE